MEERLKAAISVYETQLNEFRLKSQDLTKTVSVRNMYRDDYIHTATFLKSLYRIRDGYIPDITYL